MSGLSILSFGFTRGLWDGETAEDLQRMRGYAEHLEEYFVVTNSYKPTACARRFASISPDSDRPFTLRSTVFAHAPVAGKSAHPRRQRIQLMTLFSAVSWRHSSANSSSSGGDLRLWPERYDAHWMRAIGHTVSSLRSAAGFSAKVNASRSMAR